jgi:hypothetical protein
MYKSTFQNCYSSALGGAIYIAAGSQLNIDSSSFLNNEAMENGGSLYVSQNSIVWINGSTFQRNFAGEDGGAIFFERQNLNGSLSMYGNQFNNNSAVLRGGALYISMGILQMSFNQFILNSARKGGGIFSTDSIFQNSIQNNFSRNSATYPGEQDCYGSEGSGGAILFESILTSDVLFAGWRFESNHATFFGGGIAVIKLVNNTILNEKHLGSFLNNTAAYGSNVGSLWTTVEMRTTLPVYFEAQFVTSITLRDIWGQVTVGAKCQVKQVVSPIPPFSFSLSPEIAYLTQRNDETKLESILTISSQIASPLPYPNTTVPVFGIVQFMDSNISTNFNFSVRLCPEGYEFIKYDALKYSCHACFPGTYLSYGNGLFAVCEECPIGKYSSQAATECSLCPTGYTSSLTSSAQCQPCSAGNFNSAEGGPCSSCATGKFSSHLNSTVCTLCYGDSTTVNQASFSPYQCVCPKGTYGKPWNGQTCQPLHHWEAFVI